jgi:hypothetical protein
VTLKLTIAMASMIKSSSFVAVETSQFLKASFIIWTVASTDHPSTIMEKGMSFLSTALMRISPLLTVIA